MGQVGRALRVLKVGARVEERDSSSDDVKRQVDSAQDDTTQKPIYQLANVKSGSGKLIDLIKSSAKYSSGSVGGGGGGGWAEGGRSASVATGNLPAAGRSAATGARRRRQSLIESADQRQMDNELDRQIRELVEPLLYNAGQGQLVPLSRIWAARWGLRDDCHAAEKIVVRAPSASTSTGSVSTSGQQDERSGEQREGRGSPPAGDKYDDDGDGASSGARAAGARSSTFTRAQADAMLAAWGAHAAGCAPGQRVEQAAGRRARSRPAPKGYRWVCWKLEERGFVGETVLHICFLLSTPTHMILARKLLALFPMLINDIYTCDEYFGESSLHMAIVNEDVRIVKLLLDHGANVHERCLGSFFLPSDQKERANWSVRRALERRAHAQREEAGRAGKLSAGLEEKLEPELDSNHFSSLKTNYDGHTYWGEFPLSFAACLGLADCYKLLMAKGADPNRQDSNGNTTLHMSVIANRLDIFDLCFASGANIQVLNRQGLSPLALAAKLRRVEMFFHILAIQRQVHWVLCNVAFVCQPLAGLDSIDPSTGASDDCSALSIVVSGGSNEHLDMLNGLLSQLLSVKWEAAARARFYWWLAQFLVFLATFWLTYIGRLEREAYAARATEPAKDGPTFGEAGAARARSVEAGARDNSTSGPAHGQPSRRLHLASELLLVALVLHYLRLTSRLISAGGGARPTRSWCRWLAQAPEMSLFTCTCLLLLACIPLRLLGWRRWEDLVAAVAMFTVPLKLLFFCRASRSVGSFVVMIYKIVVNDVLCFVVFLMIFVAGFSQSFLIMFKTHQPLSKDQPADKLNYFANLFDGVISMHMMALNEFGIVFDEFNQTGYPLLARLLFLVYMLLVSILLINMLIAMLGKTYQDIASQPNENLRQWARALLVLERMWTARERRSALHRYSHCVAAGGERLYSFTCALEEGARRELAALEELKAQNARNWARLRRLARQQVHHE